MPLKTDVKLTIECENIASLDWMSKSDPMCILNIQDSSGDWVKVGRTEWQQNERNPKFLTKIKMEYTFEVKQKLQFVVVDVDDPDDLSNANELGKIECSMGQIAGARHCKLTRELQGPEAGRQYGHITVFAEEMQGRTTDLLTVKMKGSDILNKDGFMGKSDPYLIFKAIRSDGEAIDVGGGKSNTIDNSDSPINFIELCNGKLDNKIRIECWDSDPMSGDDQIGLLDTTVAELLQGGPLAMRDYKEGRDLQPGSLTCTEGGIVRAPNFLDYLGSGCEITVSFAVDFTVRPTPMRSRHACSLQRPQLLGLINIEIRCP